MASSSSPSPVFTRVLTGQDDSAPSPIFTRALISQDDSAPSPIQRKRQEYQNPTARPISHSSDHDNDDDNNSKNDDVIETLDEHPLSSALHEVNDALMGVLKSHIDLIASTHRRINRHKKTKNKDYQTFQRNFSDDNTDHRPQQGLIIDSQTHYYDSKPIKRTRTKFDGNILFIIIKKK
ncbi:unnamed protein product [Rotaria sordida]|uniref:Uncharacterized protein n=1 Tax=Rotaria sordida TaxID=392033 RepID=A0A818WUR6_9BILA|nr:unnamed protein product [Rotaria sordida]